MKKNVILLMILLGLVLILPFLFQSRCNPSEAPTQNDILATPSPSLQVIALEIKESPGIGTFPVTPAPSPVPTEPQHASFYSFFRTPIPETVPKTDAPPVVNDDAAFSISIRNQTIQIVPTLDEKALEKSPGWLTSSAAPGEEGVCVIYGHRNRNHLKVLKGTDIGDTLRIHMPDGKEYSYLVESTEILESDETLRIPLLAGKHLMLTTCYPFYYTGHAPKKFVVLASFKSNGP